MCSDEVRNAADGLDRGLAGDLAEAARRKLAARAGQTDRVRWSNPDAYEAFWSERAKVAGELCVGAGSVCDIGCGPGRSLRNCLPPETRYLPADLIAWEADVLVCDLNAHELPVRWLARCDLVCLLGVVEYVNDVPALLTRLSRRVAGLVISYNCADLADADREGYGWVNGFTTGSFLDLLNGAGFQPTTVQRVGRMELIVRAASLRYGLWQRLRRSICIRAGQTSAGA